MANALREIHHRKDIWNDFIVMYSDIVCNASLEQAMKMHYEIKQAEKEKTDHNERVIMTKVFSELAFSNPVRERSQEIVLMVDGQNS